MQLIDGKRVSTVTSFGLYGFFGPYRFLSNFEPGPLMIQGPEADGLCYPTSEHAYMALKTKDLKIRKFVAGLQTAQQARDAGQFLPLREDWPELRLHAMLAAVRGKFKQNAELALKLRETGLLYLEETNNWGDRYWGVVAGEGLNSLGKTLMQVRQELFQELAGTA